ncbi:transporter associated domain-containing protein [Devosia ginsengisoli]|uniref:transporter associated domain-containing protein n=1 Tax=Devosia ginsengisoli TaxID=400770 RepID=UPI003CCC5DEB
MAQALGLKQLHSDAHYETIGGFIVHHLRRAARKGDRVDAGGYTFEVVDADRMRLNQLLVTKQASKSAPTKSGK